MHPIGIDLGTTNSLIAVWDGTGASGGAAARLIANPAGDVLTPSVVSVGDDGQILVGKAASERRLTHPQLTASEFKRDMGSTREFQLGPHGFLPEQLSALVLGALKADAEAALGAAVTDVVISVPAYFNDTQRKATLAAAELVGLRVLRLINEPSAAALAYGLAESSASSDGACTTLVVDLGGGTFDVSVVELFDGVIEIRASTGDNYLGGEDFTEALAKLIGQRAGVLVSEPGEAELTDNAGSSVSQRARDLKSLAPEVRARLRGAAERVKRDLSRLPVVTTQISLCDERASVSISQADLERVCEPLLERIRGPVTRALRDARLDPATIDCIVLVGGATRMPLVRKLVTRLFGLFPDTSVNPDEAIALGAATQAALAARDASLEEVLLTDVCPYTLGIAVVSKEVDGQRLHDVFAPIIERNVLIPASRVEKFHSVVDHQKQLRVVVYQGEHRYVTDNIKLGELDIPLPPLPAGEAAVDVRFTYDASGLLEVDVEAIQTGTRRSLSLVGNATNLGSAEIETRRRALAALKIHPRDELPNRELIARADRLYAELGGSQRTQVGEALNDFTALLKTQDLPLIRRKRQEFVSWLDEVEALL